MTRTKRLIKFLTSDGDVYLCPYCMRHQPGVVQLCVICGHAVDRKVDIRTTDEYRKKQSDLRKKIEDYNV